MRFKAQEMLKQAGQDARFLAALQEAASAAGFELELRPKTPAVGASSDNVDDVEDLRAQARAKLVEASLDGSFMRALEETAGEEPEVQLRDQVRNKLEDALQTGELAQALSSSTDQ